MRAARVIGLGILFSFAGLVMVSVFSVMRITASLQPSGATGLSAIVAVLLEGLLEAVFSPITWLIIVIGFGAATWITRKTSKHTSTP
jgi:hypothetical protein